MNSEAAIRVLEAIGAGCDPTTGEVLGEGSVLRSGEVLQALFIAIRSLRTNIVESSNDGIDEEEHPGWTVQEAAHEHFGVNVTGGPARFSSPGWFHVGQTVAKCADCGQPLEGFRRPYFSANRTYHYWALVCRACRKAWEPRQLKEDVCKRLYDTSDLRPGPK